MPKSDAATSVRIVETGGAYKDWCALSYCWGGPQLTRTTSTNFVDGQRDLRLDEIPETILNAIATTKSLNIPFLWIDNFCILQDDPQDLMRELACMPKIYKHASLTISAAVAKTCNDGFLHPRPPRIDPAYGDPVRLQCTDDEGSEGALILHGIALPIEHIHTRGWTLQEHILSPRLLIYGTSSLAWQCRSRKYTDMPQTAPIHDSRANEVFSSLAQELSVPSLSNDRAVLVWLRIISAYSSRDLRFPSETLLPLSAIAEDFGTKMCWTYAAGLWQEQMRYMMGWSCWSLKARERPQKYRAPSWSWASIDGFDEFRGFDVSAGDGSPKAFAYRLDVNVELAVPELPFGDAKVATLTPRCMYVYATLTNHLGVPYIKTGDEEFGKVSHESESPKVFLDVPDDDFDDWRTDGEDWHVALLTFKPYDASSPYSCLAVKKIHERPVRWQRVGLFELVDTRFVVRFMELLKSYGMRKKFTKT